jgi:hypothetical protein
VQRKFSSRLNLVVFHLLASVLYLCSIALGQAATVPPETDNPRARAEYLEHKRGGPAPTGARRDALREVDQMMEREGTAYWQSNSEANRENGAVTPASPSTIIPSQSQWTAIGPQPTNPNPSAGNNSAHYAGRVTALAVDPSTPTTVYLGAAQGGLWKSVDSGTSWTALTDSQLSLATGSIAIDPTNSQIIYLGTGEENYGGDSYYGAGILKSTNGGSTWTRLGQATFTNPISGCAGDFIGCGGARIGAIAIQPGAGNNGHLLAAVNTAFSNTAGLFWSADAGTTWTAVSGATTSAADSVIFLNSTTALVGMHKQGVFKCTGFATTPSCVAANGTGGNVITTTGIERLALGTDATGSVSYAAVSLLSNGSLSGLYKSTDAGANWTKLTLPADFCTDQCWYDLLVAVNPANASNVFVGGSGFPNNNFLYRSIDGGASWTLATTSIHADQHSAAFTPTGGKMYIGNDGGVYSTTDTTTGISVNWTELNSSLNITQFYGYFGLHPTDSQVTYAGTQDNGTQKFSGNLAWDEVTCGDGASAVLDVNTPSTVFANCQNLDIRRSTTGNPGTFVTAGTGIADASRVGFIPPMVGDTGNPMKVYFGSYRLWQATSNGSSPTWTAITGDLTSGGFETITNIAITPDNSTAFVVTTDGRFSKVANLATTPSATTFTTPAPANTQVSGVAAVDSNTAYITVPGFTAGSHVFKTINGGSSWSNITNNLPNTPANDIVVDPDIASTLYLATDVGVFISTNDGASWLTLKAGLPNVAVFGLKLHRPSRTLRAATHGRGMWDLSVPTCATGPCTTVSPMSLVFVGQLVNTTSTAQNVTVTNSGTQTLTISGISVTGDFSQSNNCVSIAAGGSCTINVSFTPTAGLARTGTLSVTSNDPSSPDSIALSGTGLVVPLNDNFANPNVIGSVPYTDTVVTNGATAESSDPLPPSPSCVGSDYDTGSMFNHHSVWYSFTPIANGNFTADTVGADYDTVISIWTGSTGNFALVACNDDINPGVIRQSRASFSVLAGVTYRIMITGYYAEDSGTLVFHFGAPPVLTVSPSALTFPNQNLGTTSIAQSVTLTAVNGVVDSIGRVISGDFGSTTNCGSSLALGASCIVNVSFTPTASGIRTGSLTISSSSVGSPQVVGITATGAAALTTTSLTTTANPSIYGQPSTFTATVSSSGGTATGKVTFKDGTAILGVRLLNGSGQATLAVPLLATGAHTITALFSGSALFGPSSSAGTQTVNTAASVTSVLSSLNPAAFGMPVTFTATVGSAFGAPTGIVNFKDGASLLGTANLLATNVSLLAPANYATGLASQSVAVGDFNNDGKFDLAVANYNGNTVSVLLGNGDGSFNSATNYAAGTGSYYLVIADFNSDGVLDLAVANNSNVSVLLGNGNGTFQAASAFAAGILPTALVARDLNGDGNIDLVVANYGSNNVSVLLGNGDGTFQTAVNYVTGTAPDGIAIGDFNADGKLDLAVSNFVGNNVTILLGNGNGTFQGGVNYTSGSGPNSVAVGDFNADGKLDLVIANGVSNNVSVLLGNGDGTFPAAANFPAGVGAFSIAVGDFNADGKSDLAVTTNSNVSLLLGNGDGTFQPLTSYAAGALPAGVVTGDFNRDGKLDLAVANASSNNVSILPGSFNMQATLTSASLLAGSHSITGAYTGDTNFSTSNSLAITQTVNQAAVGLSTSSLNFAAVGVGTTSPSKPVTVTNTGTLALNITSISTTGDYGQTSSCGATINIGANCTINVVFSPSATGTRTGTLSILDNGSGSPQTVSLTGNGVVPVVNLSTPSLSFSAQRLGTTSGSQILTLSNTGGAALSISSLVASGDFSQTNTCNGFVVAGTNCTISVIFTPTSAGTRTGSLTITDNAAGSPQTVNLSGTGTTPAVSLSTSGLIFGNQFPGTFSTVQNVTLTNTGTATLTIAGVQTAGDFFNTNNCITTLGVGGSCTIRVAFSPMQLGASNGALTINDDAPSGPQSISLSGVGADIFIAFRRPSRPSRSATDIVVAGQTARVELNLATTNGATGTVALSCTGAPIGASCSVSPSTLDLSGLGKPVTVIVKTTARHPQRAARLGSAERNSAPSTPSGNYSLHITASTRIRSGSVDLPIVIN